MYNPIVGRWMEEDPIDFKAGDYDLYRYVFNQPTDLTDLSGFAGEDKITLANPKDIIEFSDQPHKQYVMMDEWLFGTDDALIKDREMTSTYLKWRNKKNVTVKVHYIVSGRDQMSGFVAHAVRYANQHKDITGVYLYFGHARGPIIDGKERPWQTALTRIKNSFATVAVPEGKAWFGFYSCLAGPYNEVIPAKYRARPWLTFTDTLKPDGLRTEMRTYDTYEGKKQNFYEAYDAFLEGLLQKSGKLEIHLYFGTYKLLPRVQEQLSDRYKQGNALFMRIRLPPKE